MFGVALCGIALLTWDGLPSPVVALPHPGDDEFLVAATHAFGLMQDDFGAVLVLHPAGAHNERRIRAARNLADSKRVLPLPLDLPNGAVAAVADLVAQLSGREVTAGAVVGSVDEILEAVTLVARTSSVAKLGAVKVDLANHARSLLPTSSFLVGLAPKPFVARLKRPAQLRVRNGEMRLATAGDELYGEPVLQLLKAVGVVTRAQRDAEHRPGREPVSWWQARRVFEATCLPVDVEPLAAALRDRPRALCQTCGDTAVESECRFCSAMEVL